MKDFFKNVLATAVGVLLVGFITGFFMVVSLVGMALSQSETAPVADNSVLVLADLGANIMEVIDRVADRLHHTVARQLSRLARVERAGIRQSSLLAAAA